MAAETEHRGWEIENNYHEHWLDDPTYDLAEDAIEDGNTGVIVLAVLVVALLVGSYLMGKWLAPPQVTFKIAPPISPPAYYVHAPIYTYCMSHDLTCVVGAIPNSSQTMLEIGR